MRKSIVLAVGVFDLFHIGHLRYLQYARAQGDALFVAVTPDRIGLNIKSKTPIIPQEQRLEIIQGLACTDKAELYPCSLEDTENAVSWIVQWGVDHVVVGGDWLGSERWQRLTPLLNAKGIRVSFAPRTEGVSTSELRIKIIDQTPSPN